MSAQGIIGFGLLAALALLGGALVFLWGQGTFIRREFERQLAGQRLWARALGDASLDGLLIHRQGVILFMNSALTRLLGVREREWLGQNFATLARGDEVAALRAMLEAPGPEMASFHLLRAKRAQNHVSLPNAGEQTDIAAEHFQRVVGKRVDRRNRMQKLCFLLQAAHECPVS